MTLSGLLRITIAGNPMPKGSMKCVGQKGRHQLVASNDRTGGKAWHDLIANGIAGRIDNAPLKHQPVGVDLTFYVPRPAGHHNARGELKPSAPDFPTTKPTQGRPGGDVDKLARAVLDALTDGRLLPDDAQVVDLTARKRWSDDEHPTGCQIAIYPLLDRRLA